jgi:hypothetical protein
MLIRISRKLEEIDVIDVLSDLFILWGTPGEIQLDAAPVWVSRVVDTHWEIVARRAGAKILQNAARITLFKKHTDFCLTPHLEAEMMVIFMVGQ